MEYLADSRLSFVLHDSKDTPSDLAALVLPKQAEPDTLSEKGFRESCAQFPRRIIAEDPTYNLPKIPYLKQLCLDKLAARYTGTLDLKLFAASERAYLMKKLPLDVPMATAVQQIPDEKYWKRRCLNQWATCDPSKYGHSWKTMCIQRTVERILENFVPGKSSPEQMTDLIRFLRLTYEHIRRLDIQQLQPRARSKKDDELSEIDEPLHLDFEPILQELPLLEEFRVTYSVKKCGEQFEFVMFQINYEDSKFLMDAVSKCNSLKILCLHRSDLDDLKTNVLVSALLKLKLLEVVELPHNKIGDRGAFALSKLMVSSGLLSKLNLLHNQIGVVGGKALSFALTKNESLRSLNLRLNRLQDGGAVAVCKALAINKSLQELNLAGNNLGESTAEALSKMLSFNITLKYLDLSCNSKVGMIGGVHILEGLEKNTTLLEVDLRLCDIGPDNEYYIDKLLRQNRDAYKSSVAR